MDVLNELEKFLLAEVAVDIDPNKKNLAPDEDLISAGIIDSMGILKLVSFMENKFGIKVKNEDVVPDNFQNLNCLKAYVEKTTKK